MRSGGGGGYGGSVGKSGGGRVGRKLFADDTSTDTYFSRSAPGLTKLMVK